MRRFAGLVAAGVTLGAASSASAQSPRVTYVYDDKGRLFSSRTEVPGCSDWTTTYTYDPVDNRRRMVRAGSSCIARLAPIQVFAGTPVEIDLADSGNQAETAGMKLVAVEGATKGKVALQNGRILYTPNADAAGSDGFTYVLTNGGVTDRATIQVNIRRMAASAPRGSR